MKRLTYAAICAAIIFCPAIASAGEYRREYQHHRIYEGVKQGTINRRELRHLERREAALDAARYRKPRDGHLTPQERRQLNRRENRISRDIYWARH